MEGLDKEKEGVLIIGTSPYPELTMDKLRDIINSVYNQPKYKEEFNWIERVYQNMSPQYRKAFDNALRNTYNINPRLVHLESKDVVIKTTEPNYINQFNKQINKKTKITNLTKKKKRKK